MPGEGWEISDSKGGYGFVGGHFYDSLGCLQLLTPA